MIEQRGINRDTLVASSPRRGRPRSGAVDRGMDASGRAYYSARIRLRDGSRVRMDIDDESVRYDEAASRAWSAREQAHEDLHGTFFMAKTGGVVGGAAATGPAGTRETCDAWFARYTAASRELGRTDAGMKARRWAKWVSPILGSKAMSEVTRADIEDVRDGLDAAIAEWKRLGKSPGAKGRAVGGKTAMNAWSALTSSFKAATTGKNRDLRVLDGRQNPCAGVEPPGDRASRQTRQKTFLYPREATQLLACEVLELAWREVYAVGLYTYLRPGELRVLTWADVDLAASVIHVTKAWDYDDEKVKPPKTRNGVRKVPIETALAPLLERMRSGRQATDLVVPCLATANEDYLAIEWRKALLVAGLERAELHVSTRTHVQSNFRSCRDSGITWLSLAGVDATKMMRRAGHDTLQTTMGYVKLAEDLGGLLGVPFPPLPAGLVDASATPPNVPEFSPKTPAQLQGGGTIRDEAVPKEGLEPSRT